MMRLFATCTGCGNRLSIQEPVACPVGHGHWLSMPIEPCTKCMAEHVQQTQLDFDKKMETFIHEQNKRPF